MPTYEYRCNECGREFEYEQKMSDDAKVTCEACGKDALERLISGGSAFMLKGSGWYKDLYSSPKPSSGEGGKGSGASTSSGSGDSGGSGSGSSGSGSSGSGSSGSGSSGSGSSGSGGGE